MQIIKFSFHIHFPFSSLSRVCGWRVLGSSSLHTVIIAMTSCNDVIAIFLFGVLCGIVFSTGNLTHQLLQGPVGIVMGCVFGAVSGLLVLKLPSQKAVRTSQLNNLKLKMLLSDFSRHKAIFHLRKHFRYLKLYRSLIFHLSRQKYSNGLRFTTIVLCGTLAVMGSKYLEYPSAGALGCIAVSFTAGTGWRKQKAKDATFNCDVEMYLNLLWSFLKPVSFSLIGKEVNFQVLESNVVFLGFLTLLVGVALRLISGYLSFCGGDMSWKERAYITLSGFPKATGKHEFLHRRCLLQNNIYDFKNFLEI